MAYPVADSYGCASGGQIAAGIHRMSEFWRNITPGWTELVMSGAKPPHGMLAYSGMALDSDNGKLYIFGGGHQDGAGEDVWDIDLEQRTSWNQHYTPWIGNNIALEIAQSYVDNDNYPGALMVGGVPTRPIARHTYKSVHWVYSLGKMVAGGGSLYSGTGSDYLWFDGTNGAWWGVPDDYWQYSPGPKTWEYMGSRRTDAAYVVTGSQHLYSRQHDRIFAPSVNGNNSLNMTEWNPQTNEWTLLPGFVAGSSVTDSIFALDSDRGKIIVLTINNYAHTPAQMFEYDIAGNSWEEISFSGASPTVFDTGSGMIYSPVSKKMYLLLNGAQTLRIFDVATHVWSEVAHPIGDLMQVEGRWVFDARRQIALLVYSSALYGVRVFAFKE